MGGTRNTTKRERDVRAAKERGVEEGDIKGGGGGRRREAKRERGMEGGRAREEERVGWRER